MSILFDFYESPDPSSAEEKPRYHARVVTVRTLSTDDVIEKLTLATTLTPGDIQNVLVSLSNLIATSLGDSERVNLDGIGTFQAVLKTEREINPEKTRAQSVWFKTVRFKPDQKLKNKLKNVGTSRSSLKRHSSKLSNEEVDNILTRYFAENETLSRRKLEELCGLRQSTASRHIRRLLDENKIRNIHLKRQAIYVPVPGYYGVKAEK